MENKNTQEKYEGFSAALAAVDLLPVILFLVLGILTAGYLGSPLLLAGAVFCTAGGFSKVLWKFLIVLKDRDVRILPLLFRIFLFGGFGVAATACLLHGREFLFLLGKMLAFPAGIFFFAGLIGMTLMIVFSGKMKASDVRANWIEEWTNTAAQTMFLISLLLACAVR